MSVSTRLLRFWLEICVRSSTWQVMGPRRSRDLLLGEQGGALVVFWHGALAISPAFLFHARRNAPDIAIHVMFSRNRDGQLIAGIAEPWGVTGIFGSTAKGSKDKGGSAALRTALRALSDGAIVVMTPDGPRGPAGHLHPGALALSRLSRCPVIPVGMAATGLRLPTWDRLAFPLPFQRGRIVLGAPLLQPDADLLQHAISDVTARAERDIRLERRSLTDRIWAVTGIMLAPALRLMAQLRRRRGREIAGRLHERRGRGGAVAKDGLRLWIHAASVGETLCVLPLVDRLLAARPDLDIIFTTATVTGCNIVSRHPENGRRIHHRFVPYDVPRWARRFLARWQPDGAVFVESELWPGLIARCQRRGIPVMLVNGRLSDRSARRWKKVPFLAGHLLKRLTWISARGTEDAARFRDLGAETVHEDGDLKQDAAPLPCDPAVLESLRAQLGDRPVFVAASTHPGEDETIVAAAALARQHQPDLLTIIVPRHPSRGPELAAAFHAPARSAGQTPQPADPLWIADTLGELGLFFRLADRAFVGHSLCAPGGGHNPFEPLRLGVPTAVGPYMGNWREAMALLASSLTTVSNAAGLASWLNDPNLVHNSATSFGQVVIEPLCHRILDTIDR